MDLEVRSDFVIPGGELQESASRASGPGGQHVNKTSTRVTLRWNLEQSLAPTEVQRARLRIRLGAQLSQAGDLVVHADRSRSRVRNREKARARLAELVSEALARQRPRRPTKPTRGSVERGLASKRRRASVKRSRSRLRTDDD